jgi:hypothetical protein
MAKRRVPTFRWAAVLAVVALALLTKPQIASACACCDSRTDRRILGWSQGGESAIVEMSSNQACESILALEIWESRSSEVTSCVDRVHGPEKLVPCDQVDYAYATGKPYRSRFVHDYPGSPRALEASQVRVVYSISPVGHLDDAQVRIVVSVKSKGKWSVVFRSSDTDLFYVHEKERSQVKRRLRVKIFPSPSRKIALLAVSGHDRSPGTGHYPTELYWAALP